MVAWLKMIWCTIRFNHDFFFKGDLKKHSRCLNCGISYKRYRKWFIGI